MKARAQLMRALEKTVAGWEISQKAAAERLGITQPRLSDLLRGKIDKFCLDTPFDLTGRVGLKVSLGIFAVAAYNGGPRNVAKLYRALDRMGDQLGELRRAGPLTPGSAVACPCVWREEASVVRAVSIPRYNRENIGYIEKYLSILSLFDWRRNILKKCQHTEKILAQEAQCLRAKS